MIFSFIIKTALTFMTFFSGIKELGMPVMDPYVNPMVEMGSDADGPMSLKFTLFNATHYGFSKSKVKKVE